VTPPGNQAANRENKPQPEASEETGLLDPGENESEKIIVGFYLQSDIAKR